MPCEECLNGKWKFGETGECRYDTEAECDEANEGKKMERAEHTCIKCENGKYKINQDGTCEFDTLEECQAAERALTEPSLIYGKVKTFDRAKAEETRTIPFIASTSTEDRHGTVLNQANWDLVNFNSNPIIGYQHNVYGGDMCNAAHPDDVIGKGVATVVSSTRSAGKDQQLDIDITFEPKELNEKADKVFRKILNGTLNAVSVGFIPKGEGRYGQLDGEGETINKETFYYDGQELLEVSVVNIPSNAQALTKTVRSSTYDGIMFLKRFWGEKLSFANIEKLTVGQIVKALDTGEAPEVKDCGCKDKEKEETKTEESTEEASEKKPNLLGLKEKELELMELKEQE